MKGLMVVKRRTLWMAGIIAVTLGLTMTEPLKATSIDEEKNKQQEIAADIQDAETILAELESLKADTAAYMEELDGKVLELNGYISSLNAQISDKNVEIEETQETLAQQEEDINEQYEAMKKRIKFMYENGQTEYIDMLLCSGSISDFLNKAEYLSKITEYDRNMLDKMKETKAQIEATEAKLQQEQTDLITLKDAADAQKASLETLAEEKAKVLQETTAQIASQEANIETLHSELEASLAVQAELEEIERQRKAEAERKAKEEEERRKQEEAERQRQEEQGNSTNNSSSGNQGGSNSGSGNSGSSGSNSGSGSNGGYSSTGKFSWPLKGYTYVSSGYEVRVSPITGKVESHTGIDIPAPTGTPIYAAGSGTVAWAYKSASAGNWIGIEHSNGLYTVYMHMSAFAVSAGDVVNEGEVIGYVGSTGWSTASHLHFSVRRNGQYVDPNNYLR